MQALLNAYNTEKTENLKKLLPILLLPDEDLNDDQKKIKQDTEKMKIYSLFEACDACVKTSWMADQRQNFMFRILDSQYSGKNQMERKGHEKWISQDDLWALYEIDAKLMNQDIPWKLSTIGNLKDEITRRQKKLQENEEKLYYPAINLDRDRETRDAFTELGVAINALKEEINVIKTSIKYKVDFAFEKNSESNKLKKARSVF